MACIGFPSIILNYNNINTIGGFLNNYPLEKKYSMKKIMKNEFKKSDKLSHNFNNYGVYCEIQSAELIFNDDLKKINDLDIDIKSLKNEGCNYIISTKKIMNFDSIISKPILYENSSNSSYLNFLYVYNL